MYDVRLKPSKRSAAREPHFYIVPEFNSGLALAPAKIHLPPVPIMRKVHQTGFDSL
jgi:hypothetical protein